MKGVNFNSIVFLAVNFYIYISSFFLLLFYEFYATHQGRLGSAKWHSAADKIVRLWQGSKWLNYSHLEG